MRSDEAGSPGSVRQQRFLAPQSGQEGAKSSRIPTGLGRHLLSDLIRLTLLRPAIRRKHEALREIAHASDNVSDDGNKKDGHAGHQIGDERERPLAGNPLDRMSRSDMPNFVAD